MANQQYITLSPMPLYYVEDDQLPNGRQITPFSINFNGTGNVLDPTGTYYTNTVQVSTTSITTPSQPDPIKGLVIKLYTNNQEFVTVQNLNTQQEYIVGSTLASASGRAIVIAHLPFFSPRGSNFLFTNYSLQTDPATTNYAVCHFTNFKIEPFIYQVPSPISINV